VRRNNWVRDGLVGAWCPSVSGWGGTVLRDLSGQGNHGTLTNMDPATDWVVSGGKQALDIDSTNDWIDIPDIAFASQFTFSAWINLSTHSGTKIILGEDSGNISGGPKIGFDGNVFFIRIILSSSATISAPATNTWTHFAITRDNEGKVDLSVSGNLPTRLYSNIAQVGTFTLAAIGANGAGDQSFGGLVDDVRAYNRDLSPNEIRLLASERGIGLNPQRRRKYFLPSTASYKNFLLWPYSLSSTKKAPVKNLPRYVKSSNRLMFPGG
jgi:hypothetical protein